LTPHLELVVVLIKGWDSLLKTLSLSNGHGEGLDLGALVNWGSGHEGPVIEDGLWESLSTGSLSEGRVETERLGNWEVSLHGEHWGTDSLLGSEHVSSSDVETRVDTTLGVLWALDLDQVHWLLKTWLGKESGGVTDTSGDWHNLSSSSVDGISMQSNIHDVESDTSHLLLTTDTLSGNPLETGNDGILDLVQVLDSLGDVDDAVRARALGAEAPDLAGLGDIPAVRVGEDAGAGLGRS